MVDAIQVRSQEVHQQQAGMPSNRSNRKGPAGPAAGLIDTSAQQQVAALGALVAVLLQLQVRRGCHTTAWFCAVSTHRLLMHANVALTRCGAT